MYREIISFWFEEIDPSQWWVKDEAFDQLIVSRFADLHRKAACCELFAWRQSSLGRLAEVIVLDQFSRNMYRNTALSFACDSLALTLSQNAIVVGADKELSPQQRSFLYMPFMHSESILIHNQAEILFASLGLEDIIEFGKKHKVIIERFGRYPHRNDLLGRDSTAEETVFLTQPDSGF